MMRQQLGLQGLFNFTSAPSQALPVKQLQAAAQHAIIEYGKSIGRNNPTCGQP